MSQRGSQQPRSGARREEVLKAILAREAQGLALNYAAVWREDRPLHRQIIRLFGRWDQAMRAAGIDPVRVRRQRRWSQQAVIARIQQRNALGLPLSAGAVQQAEATLSEAAWRYFPSWSDALAAAGIDASSYQRRAPIWTRERVIEAIQHLRRRKAPLHHAANRGTSLPHAAVKLFGSWDAALSAAGVDPAQVRRYRKPWTAEALIQELRGKHAAGEPLNARDVRPSHIRRAAGRLFGSWDAALVAAGFDPSTVRRNGRRG